MITQREKRQESSITSVITSLSVLFEEKLVPTACNQSGGDDTKASENQSIKVLWGIWLKHGVRASLRGDGDPRTVQVTPAVSVFAPQPAGTRRHGVAEMPAPSWRAPGTLVID